MIYQDFIELPFSRFEDGPYSDDMSDCYPISFPAYFIQTYAKPKAKIFDPFMGVGTTAFAAEALDCIPYGFEWDRARYEWAAGQIQHWQNIKHGDSADLAQYGLPKMDMLITSPPYMLAHQKWNPLASVDDANQQGYQMYLERLDYIFAQCVNLMKKNALIIVHADNVQRKTRGMTPLVHDFASLLSKHSRFQADVIVKWKKGAPDYMATHALVFKV